MEKIELFKKYNLILNEEKLNKLNEFYNNLILYNKSFNLTAITEENEVFIKHFLDSIYPEKFIKQNSKILDIGAGAGFPSLPLKIYRPDLKITMIDSLNKRVNFLNDMINILSLNNEEALHYRSEDLAKNNRNNYDYVVVRAVAKLPTLLEYSIPFLKLGGKLLAYKSSFVEEEVKDSFNALKLLGAKLESIEKFDLEGNARSVIIVKKVAETPLKYPRNKNLPKLKPL